MARAKLISCIGTDVDLALVPHFITHYAGLGIAPTDMHFVLQARSAAADGLAAAEATLARIGTAPPRRWIAPYTSQTMWAERHAVQRDVARPGDWIVNADLDEHYTFPDTLDAVIAHCETLGVNCVQGLMVDRLAPDGVLAQVAETPSLSRQFPIWADVSLHLFGDGSAARLSATTKVVLHRADVKLKVGGHNPTKGVPGPVFLTGARLADFPQFHDPATRFRFPFLSHHYKWIGARQTNVAERIAVPGASDGDRTQGRQFLDYTDRHGRIRLEDVALCPSGIAPQTETWRGAMADLRGTPDPEASVFARMYRRLRRG